ncbi:hypothetical protein IQ35_01586 [Sphingobium wenxiniae]|uniref:Uncharacterized protein n=1 Tax=Sphingobium wenxiniae (strain DSM 21828 / CGMCC 1.7748 / JZ-1) TaxID=595605 RepID=A0A562KIT1_SPHWJ|nr:hypothetical protein IQ35_01586 [Sphingobium wenxiniae]
MNKPTTDEITVRLYKQMEDGKWEDFQQDYGLEDFAGFLPAVGDMILEPGVLQGLDRYKAENRKMLTVVQRIFNPRDLPNYVVLVVTEHTPEGREATAVSIR